MKGRMTELWWGHAIHFLCPCLLHARHLPCCAQVLRIAFERKDALATFLVTVFKPFCFSIVLDLVTGSL